MRLSQRSSAPPGQKQLIILLCSLYSAETISSPLPPTVVPAGCNVMYDHGLATRRTEHVVNLLWFKNNLGANRRMLHNKKHFIHLSSFGQQ